MEIYKRSEFFAHGIQEHFVQDNYSHSTYGVLRGLHYQRPPNAQGKLVYVQQGEIFDVVVDIRKGSPTYGKWIGVTLSDQNRKMLYLPKGFAHGFCVLSNTADVIYKVSAEYAPESEGGILWNDPDLAIHWPVRSPVLSRKDAQLPLLRELEPVFSYHKESVTISIKCSKETARDQL